MTEEEIQEYFPKVYPKMFVGQYGGIDVGPGWFDLVNTMCQIIQSHCDWKPECPQVTVDQIKEKFGGLRFYYSGGDEYVSGVAAMAEAMSGHICEVCGKPGTTEGPGWVRTLCEEHKKGKS